MAIDYSFLIGMFNNTAIAGITWIIPTCIAMIALIAISRDSEDLKSLLLPVMYGFHTIGIRQNFVLMILAGILYVQEGLSINIIGTTISAIASIPSVSARIAQVVYERRSAVDRNDEYGVARHVRRQGLASETLLGPLEMKYKKMSLIDKLREAPMERELRLNEMRQKSELLPLDYELKKAEMQMQKDILPQRIALARADIAEKYRNQPKKAQLALTKLNEDLRMAGKEAKLRNLSVTDRINDLLEGKEERPLKTYVRRGKLASEARLGKLEDRAREIRLMHTVATGPESTLTEAMRLDKILKGQYEPAMPRWAKKKSTPNQDMSFAELNTWLRNLNKKQAASKPFKSNMFDHNIRTRTKVRVK